MDVREKLVELLNEMQDSGIVETPAGFSFTKQYIENDKVASHLFDNGVTVQECAYWQYIEDDVDEDNNIQAYCSVCHAGDKHATSMIGKVPYCWKCGRKMMPQPPKGE